MHVLEIVVTEPRKSDEAANKILSVLTLETPNILDIESIFAWDLRNGEKSWGFLFEIFFPLDSHEKCFRFEKIFFEAALDERCFDEDMCRWKF